MAALWAEGAGPRLLWATDDMLTGAPCLGRAAAGFLLDGAEVLYNEIRQFFCYCSYVEENQKSFVWKKNTPTNGLFKTTRNENRNEIE